MTIPSSRVSSRSFWGLVVVATAGVACGVNTSGLPAAPAVPVLTGTGGTGVGGAGTMPKTAVTGDGGAGGASNVTGTGGQGGARDDGDSAATGGSGAGTDTGTGGSGETDGTGGVIGGAGGRGGLAGAAGRVGGATGNMGGMSVGGMSVGGMSGVISQVGCADGTREAFISITNFPRIAGCSGGWTTAGVLSAASMAPACGRAAGNNGRLPLGTGCTVEDLCADGWHVCQGVNELDALNVTCANSGIATTGNALPLFFATRQRGTSPTACTPNDATGLNDVHGCGNFGLAEDPNCAPPLNRQLSHTECTATPPWSCNPPDQMQEALAVIKPGPAAGGVLCCRP